jgi:hypothetical protein
MQGGTVARRVFGTAGAVQHQRCTNSGTPGPTVTVAATAAQPAASGTTNLTAITSPTFLGPFTAAFYARARARAQVSYSVTRQNLTPLRQLALQLQCSRHALDPGPSWSISPLGSDSRSHGSLDRWIAHFCRACSPRPCPLPSPRPRQPGKHGRGGRRPAQHGARTAHRWNAHMISLPK